MTAEIALLNKTAVALAADSAATVSSQFRQEKVFNSEDKLFELSSGQPIGVMIYNSTTFMETPVHILIKEYRSLGRTFKTIDDAAKDFRKYLRDFGNSLDPEIRSRNFSNLVGWPLREVTNRVQDIVTEKMRPKPVGGSEISDLKVAFERMQNIDRNLIYNECAEFYIETFKNSGFARFTSSKARKIIESMRTRASQREKLSDRDRIIDDLIETFLLSSASSTASTGFVIAGFAENELFPSLRSFEVDGMIGSDLRFVNSDQQDINFKTSRAKILPFAQQDMVDRFIKGIDQESQRKIENFCRERLVGLHKELLDVLSIENASDRENLEAMLDKANDAYILGLQQDGFGSLRNESQEELEGMVEFMPKVDLAQMAESLVELTSIKRRVSRGFETVGGPIDVAVISKSEGFVWIKRKHYFPADLNARFFERTRIVVRRGAKADEHDEQDVSTDKGPGGKDEGGATKTRRTKPAAGSDVSKPKGPPRRLSKKPSNQSESDP